MSCILYTVYNAPHIPIMIPNEWNETYNSSFGPLDQQIVATMITILDYSIGEIINELKSNETLWNNTIIVFLSDHGAGSTKNNYPLRGTKNTLWEGGVRTVAAIGYVNLYEILKYMILGKCTEEVI